MKILILLAAATLVIGASYALNLDKAQPPESRIINGDEASTTDVPYQVGLYMESPKDRKAYKCGGALISERVVLTAAHCFVKSELAGWAFLGTNRYAQGTRVRFSRVTIHKGYIPKLEQNDIALVHLDKAVKPNGSTIKIIELDRNYLEVDTEVTVSGFGVIKNGVENDKLFYTQMFVRSEVECLVFEAPIIESMVCVRGDYGEEPCHGDSGGPVVRNWPNNPTHVAIVSFGAGCQTLYPKVFTRTASYIDWIEENM